MMNQPLIELKNIVRRYGHGDTETTVLKSINLKIYAGEMVAIVGLRDWEIDLNEYIRCT